MRTRHTRTNMANVQYADHTHGETHHDSDSKTIIFVVLFALILFLFLIFGFQAFRGSQSSNVAVPDKVDVNLNK